MRSVVEKEFGGGNSEPEAAVESIRPDAYWTVLREELDRLRISIFTGVPCSLLAPLIGRIAADPGATYIHAANEGEATAIAAGAWFAGGLGAVLLQNSGLGNAVNPIASLLSPYRIPVLFLIGWRGMPGRRDEPQHELMGEVSIPLLELLGVSAIVAGDIASLRPAFRRAAAILAGDGSIALLVPARSGAVAPAVPLEARARGPSPIEQAGTKAGMPSRMEVLREILGALPPEALVVSTTGKTSRELYQLKDRAEHLYAVGSMGLASAIGLGISAGAAGGKLLVVIDGDGAALMHLGNFATISRFAAGAFIHIVLDNQAHDSTGGQPTTSGSADLAAIAAASGYARVIRCRSPDAVAPLLASAVADGRPTFIHIPITTGSASSLGRPTIPLPELARRFRAASMN
jgi:phosphonopyruvate decarboxylase